MITSAEIAENDYAMRDFGRAVNKLTGVGPDAPIDVAENGAKQSAMTRAFTLLPAVAVSDIAAILHAGAKKYGADNWRGIPVDSHLNHALQHAFAYLAGDTQDDHLGHAACRMLMALEIAKTR